MPRFNASQLLQISALVTMYSHEEDIDGAIDVFKQAIEHYQSEQVRTSRLLVSSSGSLFLPEKESTSSDY